MDLHDAWAVAVRYAVHWLSRLQQPSLKLLLPAVLQAPPPGTPCWINGSMTCADLGVVPCMPLCQIAQIWFQIQRTGSTRVLVWRGQLSSHESRQANGPALP